MRASSKMLFFLAAAGVAASGLSTSVLAMQPAQTISPEWFSGTWSDRADCSQPVQFFRDGSYRAANGGTARWRIERGNILVFEGDGRRQEMEIVRIDENRLRAVQSGVISYRCPVATQAVTAAWLIGTWSDPRDCSEPFYITGDGGFRAPNGVLGRWTLAGDMLTLQFGEQRQTVQVIRVSDNELKLAQTGVSSYRCG